MPLENSKILSAPLLFFFTKIKEKNDQQFLFLLNNYVEDQLWCST